MYSSDFPVIGKRKEKKGREKAKKKIPTGMVVMVVGGPTETPRVRPIGAVAIPTCRTPSVDRVKLSGWVAASS